MPPLTDEDVDIQFGRQYRALSTQLKDLSKLVPKEPVIPADQEEVPDYLEGEIATSQRIIDDADFFTGQFNEMEKEFKQFFRSLRTREDQGVAQLWSDNICTTTGILDTVSLVLKQRREHTTILRKCKTMLGRTQRQLALVHPPPPPPPPAGAVPLGLLARTEREPFKVSVYDGVDKREYQSWWEAFEASTDLDINMSTVQKFTELKAKLQGQALLKIKYLPLTAANYDVAKGILQRAYGDKEYLVELIKDRLLNMPYCNSRQDVEAFHEEVESALQQLEGLMGGPCTSDEIRSQLHKRLPVSYLQRVLPIKERYGVNWDLQALRNTIAILVKEDKDVKKMAEGREQAKQDEKSRAAQSRTHPPKDKEKYHTMSFSTVQNEQKSQPAWTTNPKKEVRQPQRSINFRSGQISGNRNAVQLNKTPKPCLFCNNIGHALWKCPMNSRARTQTILNAKRCTRCLQEGHFNAQCRAENCRKCGGSHHTFLHYDNPNSTQGNAPNKFKLQQRNGQQPEVNVQPAMTTMAYNPGYPYYVQSGFQPNQLYYPPPQFMPSQPVQFQPNPVSNYSSPNRNLRGSQNGWSDRPAMRQMDQSRTQVARQHTVAASAPQNQANRHFSSANGRPQEAFASQIVTYSEAEPDVTATAQPDGSQIQLMTRVVTAINPDSPRMQQMNTGLMLDLGSTGTYMTSDLSYKLRLPNGPKREIGLIRFGDQSASAQIKGTLNVTSEKPLASYSE